MYEDVVDKLEHREIHPNIVETIRQLNTGNTTGITSRTTSTSTDEVNIHTGVRQGLSTLLFNLIMDKIIGVRRVNHGLQNGRQTNKGVMLCRDIMLFADSEDCLQPSLRVFNIEAQKLSKEVSTSKTNSMVIARKARRCKLELNNKIIEQVAEFTYLCIMILPYGNLKESVRHQMNKAARISSALG
ncbi:hypothetical protein Trydic_g19226 [Trypoxylus dichotomus]